MRSGESRKILDGSPFSDFSHVEYEAWMDGLPVRRQETVVPAVWSKYPNALLCSKLRSYHTARFILNCTALLPILIIHESRLGKDGRGMDWKKLLGSIITSVDVELQLRRAYLAASWMHWVRMEGLSPLFSLHTHVQRLLLCECTRHEHQLRLPQSMRKVSVLPMVDHHPIRDGPIRNRLGPGGLLQDDDRVAT